MDKMFYEKYWRGKDVLEDFAYKWPVIAKLLPPDAPIRWLDYGCGKGVILKEIAKLRPKYLLFGVDIVNNALRKAQNRLPQATLKLLPANHHIPFPDNYFDYILAADVLEHIYDTPTAFQELARVLRQRGKIIITVPYNGKLKVILATLLAFDQYFHPYSPHIRFFSKSSLLGCLKAVRLRPEKVGYYGRFYPLSNGLYVVAQK